MRASLVVIPLIRFKQVAKMPFAKHNNIVQAIPPDRADQPFRISVLPWRSRCSRPVTNAHRTKATNEDVAVNSVAVTDDVSRRCSPTVGLCELACDPRWVRGNSQPQNLSATVLQYQQSIEQSEGDGRNHEHIHRYHAVSMIMQKRPPARGWRPPMLCHVFGNRGLSDIDAELEELTVDARCAPERVRDAHVSNELPDIRMRPWAATARSRFPTPIGSKAGAVPADHCVRPNHCQCVKCCRY